MPALRVPTGLGQPRRTRNLFDDIAFADFSTTLTRSINAPLADTLSILQDPIAFTSLSSLFKSIQGPDQSGSFKVTETLPILDIFNTSTSFDVQYIVNDDGLSSDVQASAGTKLKARWVATDAGDGTTDIVEDIEATALRIFGSYVWDTLQANHKSTLDNLKTKVEGISSLE